MAKVSVMTLDKAPVAETPPAKGIETQVYFNRPGDPIHVPRISELVDYEGELGIVIGRRCRHVPASRAHEGIAAAVEAGDRELALHRMRRHLDALGALMR